jgi:hypothetical protein
MDCSVAGPGKIQGGAVTAASLLNKTRTTAFEPAAVFAAAPGNALAFGPQICRGNLGRSLKSGTAVQAAPKL